MKMLGACRGCGSSGHGRSLGWLPGHTELGNSPLEGRDSLGWGAQEAEEGTSWGKVTLSCSCRASICLWLVVGWALGRQVEDARWPPGLDCCAMPCEQSSSL